MTLYRNVKDGDLLEIDNRVYRIKLMQGHGAYLKYLKFEDEFGEVLFDNRCLKCNREQTKFSPLCEIHFAEEYEKVIA